MAHSGGCLCGSVRYEIDGDVKEAGACHCGMCRKFSGGVYIATQVAADGLRLTAEDGHTVYSSSPWAERGFCNKCGSSLYYRVTAPGDHHGQWHIAIGTLDDANGIPMTGEIYIDKKPDGYAFAGETHQMTEAEVMKMFGMA